MYIRTQEDGDYMLLSEAMERGLYHPRCKHGCGTYYPEIEHINQYETPDNKLNDYGDKVINAAHIDNMIQRYKRLVAGSVDKNNIEKYQQQLKLWEQEKIRNESDPSIHIDITDGSQYEVLTYDMDSIEDYKAYIEPQYQAQQISSEDNAVLWAVDGGYIQNSAGYSDINSYMRGLKPSLDNPKCQKTMDVLLKQTSKASLQQNYVGYRKVDVKYLKDVLGIDISGKTKWHYEILPNNKRVGSLVPKDKDAAEYFVKQINKRVGTESAMIPDKAVTSVSLCEKINYFKHRAIQFEIQMPKETKGLITDNYFESEFITKPNTTLEILGAEVYNDGRKDCVRVFAKLIQ